MRQSYFSVWSRAEFYQCRAALNKKTSHSNARFKLLEALAEFLSDRLLKEYPISSLRLTIIKPDAVADAAGVGVTIERGTN